MIDRYGPLLAWSAVAVYILLIGGGLALRMAFDEEVAFVVEVLWRTGYGLFAVIGAVIIGGQPRSPIGWICVGIGVSGGIAGAAQDYAVHSLLHADTPLPGSWFAGWLGSWPWYFSFTAFSTVLLLLFPNGRLPSPRWRPVAWAAWSGIALACFWAAFAPRALEGPAGMPQNPWAITALRAEFEALETVLFPALLLLGLLSGASVVVRFRRSRGEERQQLKWFASSAVLLVVAIALRGLLRPSAPGSPLTDIVETLVEVAFYPVPLSIGVAVRRYGLYEIDRILNRTLVYGVLTALLGLVYIVGVSALGPLLATGPFDSELAVAASTVAAAGLFAPSRRRVQDVVDRRFNRARYDATRAVEAFRGQLRGSVDLDDVRTELLAAVQHTVQPGIAALWLRQPDAAPSRQP